MAIDFLERCETIEECYEFMLAYAGQGLLTDSGSQSGSQVRQFLQRSAHSLIGLTESCARAVGELGLEPADKYQNFFSVLDRDVQDSLAAVELVLAQPAISSQLVDNLNASMHIRALLTDLFLIGEVLRSHSKPAAITTE